MGGGYVCPLIVCRVPFFGIARRAEGDTHNPGRGYAPAKKRGSPNRTATQGKRSAGVPHSLPCATEDTESVFEKVFDFSL